QQALIAAAGVKIEALADDGVVVPGQQTKLSLIIANHGAVDVAVEQVKLEGFEGSPACTLTAVVEGGGRGGRGGAAAAAGPPLSVIRKDQVARCEPTVAIPAEAKPTEPYWHRDGESGRYTFDEDAPFGLPLRPTPFHVQLTTM